MTASTTSAAPVTLFLRSTDLGSGKLNDARIPQVPHDRGYAESREQAMADFKTAWERKSVKVC